jgi:hypothetical protein
MYKKGLIGVVFIFVISYTVYSFPIQKNSSEKNLEKYLILQGIDKDNIQSKKIYKNYKQAGYMVDIVYKDDSNYMYAYWYSPSSHSFKYNILCTVYNKQNVSVDITHEKIKYPPLEF